MCVFEEEKGLGVVTWERERGKEGVVVSCVDGSVKAANGINSEPILIQRIEQIYN